MNKRENLLSLYKRQGYEKAPVEFSLSPELEKKFKSITKSEQSYREYFSFSQDIVFDLPVMEFDPDNYLKYYNNLAKGAKIDFFGVAHEPGSEAAKHMTYMRNPLKNCETMSEMEEYLYPVFDEKYLKTQIEQAENIHSKGLASLGCMQASIWESAWYIRGMQELMMDMISDDPMAEFILDKITSLALIRAESFAKAGCDMIYLGDDIGMQHSIMMSEQLYCDWIKPRIKKVIDGIRKIKPDTIVLYHSCGYIEPFIPHLIDIGIDVLNPVQPECMDFAKLHSIYGEKISFNGVLGTQSTMPFGTPDDVRRVVFENLEIAGDKGGLLCCPTHLLEPEVPFENIFAYVKACEDFK